jgi:hypothetical protein
MDSAYMGDVAMTLIGRHEWKINMVGTVQSNRTGGGKQGVEDINALNKASYDMLFYQHAYEPLTYTIWADNNFVKTLSNFHAPTVSVGGVKRKRRNDDGRREFHRTSVDCPEQMRTYCETFHLIITMVTSQGLSYIKLLKE